MHEDRKINNVRAHETIQVYGTRGIPGYRYEHSQHKANVKAIDRHEKLSEKKQRMASKMRNHHA